MAIKKFSQFVEEAPAQDYVPDKSDGPSKGEKDFINQHTMTKTDYTPAPGQDFVFNGEIKEEVELEENKNLVKDYQDMKSKGKKDSDIIDVLMSMPKYKRMDKDQMRKIIGDARRKGIFKEDVELFEGKVLDALEDIVKTKSAKKVKFANGKSTRIDMTTANAMLNLHKKLNPQNKKKMEDAIEKSPEMLMRLMDVAFKG